MSEVPSSSAVDPQPDAEEEKKEASEPTFLRRYMIGDAYSFEWGIQHNGENLSIRLESSYVQFDIIIDGENHTINKNVMDLEFEPY